MKKKYVDPRVEKMVKPLRDADKAAKDRFENDPVQKAHLEAVERRRKDAGLIRDLLQRCGLAGCEAHLDTITIPLNRRKITLKVQ